MTQSQPEFNPKQFVEAQIEQIRKELGKERALVAISGGVDSSTAAALVHRSIGNNLLCVMLDDAFMRDGEPEKVAKLLSKPPLSLPLRILNVQERFLKEMRELRDAEEKRKVFRETFYRVLSETAQREGIRYLVQGTILADIIETAGGVKTQHNVLSQIGISPKEHYGFQLVEPLKTLFKGQVRQVARHLGLPKEISERQPFPGPGLSVRVVGEIKRDKLESLRKATSIAEDKLGKHAPSQYFAVILDNVETLRTTEHSEIESLISHFFKAASSQISLKVFQDKATGVREGNRTYGEIAGVRVTDEKGRILNKQVQDLVKLQETMLEKHPTFTRLFYAIHERQSEQPYVISIRAVNTADFLTAKVSEIPWKTLNEIAQEIITTSRNVSTVYYDVTPKPPATIEME